MERFRLLTQNGQELSLDDFNTASGTGAVSDDRMIAELFRPSPCGSLSTAIAKGIIPYGYSGRELGGVLSRPPSVGVVASSGAADGSVYIHPFRAVIGSRTQPSATSSESAWRVINTAVAQVSAGVGGGPQYLPQRVTLAASISNDRWDLVWAKVSVQAMSETDDRYIRDPDDGNISSQTTVIEVRDVVTIGVTAGSESASPAFPTIPTDAGSDFYIPLAFVSIKHPFTSSSTLSNLHIVEAAPVLSLAEATGARKLAPATSQYATGQAGFTTTPPVSPNYDLPDSYLPPTMVGGESRFIAMNYDLTAPTHPTGTVFTLDNSVDWRKRMFKWQMAAKNGGSSDKFVWNGGDFPSQANRVDSAGASGLALGMGQSFKDDGTALVGTAGGVVAHATAIQLVALAQPVTLYVNLGNGNLLCKIGTSPSARIFIWIDATAQFGNGITF